MMRTLIPAPCLLNLLPPYKGTYGPHLHGHRNFSSPTHASFSSCLTFYHLIHPAPSHLHLQLQMLPRVLTIPQPQSFQDLSKLSFSLSLSGCPPSVTNSFHPYGLTYHSVWNLCPCPGSSSFLSWSTCCLKSASSFVILAQLLIQPTEKLVPESKAHSCPFLPRMSTEHHLLNVVWLFFYLFCLCLLSLPFLQSSFYK